MCVRVLRLNGTKRESQRENSYWHLALPFARMIWWLRMFNYIKEILEAYVVRLWDCAKTEDIALWVPKRYIAHEISIKIGIPHMKPNK